MKERGLGEDLRNIGICCEMWGFGFNFYRVILYKWKRNFIKLSIKVGIRNSKLDIKYY